MSLAERAVGSATRPCTDRGSVFTILTVSIVALMVGVSFVLDYSRGYSERHRIRIATDAGALAAAALLVNNPISSSAVEAEARAVARQNGITDAEIDAGGGVALGNWDFTLQVFTPGGLPTNAVRVGARVTTAVFFSRLLGLGDIYPTVDSIGAAQGVADQVPCIVPFGITESALAGVDYGDIIGVGRNSPGNWGKLDLSGNMSSNPQFQSAFENNVCDRVFSIGEEFSPGTGFAGIDDAWDDRAQTNPIAVFPVVDRFGNGNSSDSTIVGFIVGELMPSSGNGANWGAQIRVLNLVVGFGNSGISRTPFARSRQLVR